MKPAIEGRGLTQRFGTAVALWPLDVTVQPGERLAVLGGNGAGKTTLLRLLATAVRPAAGELRLFGLDAWDQRTAVRSRLGYVGDRTGLYPALSALENLELFCTLRGLPRVRAATTLERLGLGARAGRPAGGLSKGEQQRLALARSLLHDPELWLLDEPDAGLDEPGRRLLDELAGERTLVLATHSRALAGELCARALRLEHGRLVAGPQLHVLEAGS